MYKHRQSIHIHTHIHTYSDLESEDYRMRGGGSIPLLIGRVPFVCLQEIQGCGQCIQQLAARCSRRDSTKQTQWWLGLNILTCVCVCVCLQKLLFQTYNMTWDLACFCRHIYPRPAVLHHTYFSICADSRRLWHNSPSRFEPNLPTKKAIKTVATVVMEMEMVSTNW